MSTVRSTLIGGISTAVLALMCLTAPALGQANSQSWSRHRGDGDTKIRGFDTEAPRISAVSPSPQSTVVSNLGLTRLLLTFSEPVDVPDDAIRVWGQVSGPVDVLWQEYDAESDRLTVGIASTDGPDRLTIVVDYSITDASGNVLDGEIDQPTVGQTP